MSAPACGGFPTCRCGPFPCAVCDKRLPEHAACPDCAGALCEMCCDVRKNTPEPTDIEPDHAAATGPECAACEPERYECQDPDCTGGCSDCRAERRNRREEARAERGDS